MFTFSQRFKVLSLALHPSEAQRETEAKSEINESRWTQLQIGNAIQCRCIQGGHDLAASL